MSRLLISESYRQRLVDDYGTRKWGDPRGPIEAMELSLHRLGWYSDDGLTLVDDLGITRKITSMTPALWKTIIVASMQRYHEPPDHSILSYMAKCKLRMLP